jgi:hypothetical protein
MFSCQCILFAIHGNVTAFWNRSTELRRPEVDGYRRVKSTA